MAQPPKSGVAIKKLSDKKGKQRQGTITEEEAKSKTKKKK